MTGGNVEETTSIPQKGHTGTRTANVRIAGSQNMSSTPDAEIAILKAVRFDG